MIPSQNPMDVFSASANEFIFKKWDVIERQMYEQMFGKEGLFFKLHLPFFMHKQAAYLLAIVIAEILVLQHQRKQFLQKVGWYQAQIQEVYLKNMPQLVKEYHTSYLERWQQIVRILHTFCDGTLESCSGAQINILNTKYEDLEILPEHQKLVATIFAEVNLAPENRDLLVAFIKLREKYEKNMRTFSKDRVYTQLIGSVRGNVNSIRITLEQDLSNKNERSVISKVSSLPLQGIPKLKQIFPLRQTQVLLEIFLDQTVPYPEYTQILEGLKEKIIATQLSPLINRIKKGPHDSVLILQEIFRKLKEVVILLLENHPFFLQLSRLHIQIRIVRHAEGLAFIVFDKGFETMHIKVPIEVLLLYYLCTETFSSTPSSQLVNSLKQQGLKNFDETSLYSIIAHEAQHHLDRYTTSATDFNYPPEQLLKKKISQEILKTDGAKDICRFYASVYAESRSKLREQILSKDEMYLSASPLPLDLEYGIQGNKLLEAYVPLQSLNYVSDGFSRINHQLVQNSESLNRHHQIFSSTVTHAILLSFLKKQNERLLARKIPILLLDNSNRKKVIDMCTQKNNLFNKTPQELTKVLLTADLKTVYKKQD